MVSLDGGQTWRLKERTSEEIERLTRIGRALKSFRHPGLEEHSRMVNHAPGDEHMYHLGLPALSEVIPGEGRNALMPQRLWRNVQPFLSVKTSFSASERITKITYNGRGTYIRRKIETMTTENTNTEQTTPTNTILTEAEMETKLGDFRSNIEGEIQGGVFSELIPTFGKVENWTPEFRAGLEAQIAGVVDYAVEGYHQLLLSQQQPAA